LAGVVTSDLDLTANDSIPGGAALASIGGPSLENIHDYLVGESFTASSGATVILSASGHLSFDATSLSVTMPSTDVLYYLVVDGGDERSATVSITYGPEAYAQDDMVVTDEDTPITFSVADNDFLGEGLYSISEVNGGAIFDKEILVLPSGSLLTVSTNGILVYDPSDQYEDLPMESEAVDQFSYTLDNGLGTQTTATVTMRVLGVNDSPDILPASFVTSQDDSLLGDFISSSGSTDVDGDELNVVAVNGQALQVGGELINLASGGRLTIDEFGSFTFNPNDAFDFLGAGQSQNEIISLSVSDSHITSSANMTISVQGSNDPPMATPLAATTNEDEAAFQLDLLSNAIDVDQGDVLSIENFEEEATIFGGFAIIGASFTFDANQFDSLEAGESQIINYAFDVVDASGARVETTLELTVEGRDEP
jgi:VCBS repeat-containing protein